MNASNFLSSTGLFIVIVPFSEFIDTISPKIGERQYSIPKPANTGLEAISPSFSTISPAFLFMYNLSFSGGTFNFFEQFTITGPISSVSTFSLIIILPEAGEINSSVPLTGECASSFTAILCLSAITSLTSIRSPIFFVR